MRHTTPFVACTLVHWCLTLVLPSMSQWNVSSAHPPSVEGQAVMTLTTDQVRAPAKGAFQRPFFLFTMFCLMRTVGPLA